MFIVQIAGRLGKDPETRFTPSGQKVTTFNIATNHRKGKEEVTVWVRVTIWGDHLDKILSYLKKGSAVIVIGRMMPPSTYTDKEGRAQFSLEVTAEMIEFSPFGSPDRIQEGQPAQQGYQPHQGSEYGYGTATSTTTSTSRYEESPFTSHATSTKNGYGTGTMAGQGANQNSLDDDTLPF